MCSHLESLVEDAAVMIGCTSPGPQNPCAGARIYLNGDPRSLSGSPLAASGAVTPLASPGGEVQGSTATKTAGMEEDLAIHPEWLDAIDMEKDCDTY